MSELAVNKGRARRKAEKGEVDELLSVEQAVKQHWPDGGMSEFTMRHWIRTGFIGSVKIRHRVYIRKSELRRIIEESTRPAVRSAKGAA
jgi:hypothetical protein